MDGILLEFYNYCNKPFTLLFESPNENELITFFNYIKDILSDYESINIRKNNYEFQVIFEGIIILYTYARIITFIMEY
jgi:hypothetical protein